MAELPGITEQCVEMAEAKAHLERQKKSTKKDRSKDREVANTGRERSDEDRCGRDKDDHH